MAKQPDEITVASAFRVAPVPDLGLVNNAAYALRVYVLLCCGGRYYVGIAPRGDVRKRIRAQFAGDGSHFCAINKPRSVLMVWPAASEAIEAAVFYGMQRTLGVSDFRKLGGWTQTSVNPSPSVVMHMKESGRQLSNRCFACGGSHHAKYKRCPGTNLDCWYKCIVCNSRNNISSRGQSTLHPREETSMQSPLSAAVRVPAAKANAAPAPSAKAQAATSHASRKRPTAEAFLHAVCPLSFDQCWDSDLVRKSGPYRSAKDFLKVMGTVWAGRAMPTVKQRVVALAETKGWPAGLHKDLEEFRAPTGGGLHGVGCSKAAMRDVYAKFARRV